MAQKEKSRDYNEKDHKISKNQDCKVSGNEMAEMGLERLMMS